MCFFIKINNKRKSSNTTKKVKTSYKKGKKKYHSLINLKLFLDNSIILSLTNRVFMPNSNINNSLNIREHVSSSKFDLSSFFEPQLRSIRSADFEPIIVETFDNISEQVNIAWDEIEASISSLEQKLSSYNNKLSSQLDNYQSSLSVVTKKLENICVLIYYYCFNRLFF